MKQKLFSIFFSLALLLPLYGQATNQDSAQSDVGTIRLPFDGNHNVYFVSDANEVNKVSFVGENNRRNAPQVAWDFEPTFNPATEMTHNLDDGDVGTLDLWYMQFRRNGNSYPTFYFNLLFERGTTYNYGSVTGPPLGTYTVNNSGSGLYDHNFLGDVSGYQAKYYKDSKNYFTIRYGTITFYKGANGRPYIIAELNSDINGSNSGWLLRAVIGSPLTHSISVTKSPNITATITGTGSFVEGGSTTLTVSNVQSGYHFVRWVDGGTTSTSTSYTISNIQSAHNVTAEFAVNATNITITLNNQSATTAGTASVTATLNANTNLNGNPAITVPTKTNRHFGGYYTGTKGSGVQIINASGSFIAQAGGDNTYLDASKNWKYGSDIPLYAYWYNVISTAVSPSGYGTVSGANNYAEDATATLTATSANEHLYIFDHWLKDGNAHAGGATITPTVTADATYTAVFRDARAGTIEGVADHGTISGTGNYAGGTAVQLGVTPDDGYSFTQWSDGNTDNPRTVYVDGNATYTAQFMYGVSLNLLAGCDPDAPMTYRVLLPDYEVYFKAANGWSYGNGEEVPLEYINTSASYIKDHGTIVTIGNDVYAYTHTEGERKILELNFTGSNGKYYQILLRGADYATDCSQNFDQTFTNLTTQNSGTGWRILYADNGVTESAANDMFGHDHWDIYLPVYIDESKCGSANNGVPSGIYPILDTDEDGTIRATVTNNQSRASGYWTCQGINQMHKLVTGYMDIVNRDGNTYAQIDGYTSSCYPLHCVAKSSSSVTTPFAITCTASEGGTAGIIWHSATCGDVVYDAGTQKFFSGNSITLTATPNSGYEFWRWSDEDASVQTSAYGASRNVTVSGNLTLQAIFRVAGPATHTLDLYDNKDATYYNNIKALNGQTYDVTYHRSVKYESDNGNARWYTLCLPFDVDQSQLTNAGLLRKVYEYRYATGSADVGDQVTFHFRVATSMEAGQGYLVKATGDMGPDFTFTGVTLDTDKDTETNVNALKTNSANAYKESGDIAIVGVLRSGTLSNDDRKVMGLANNMIWYPHSSGNPMPAYRAYFYNPSASASSVMPRVRIVVEGEGTTELEVVDGELYDARGNNAGGDVRAPSKYIRNGVLIIERNGVRYDAQGKRL